MLDFVVLSYVGSVTYTNNKQEKIDLCTVMLIMHKEFRTQKKYARVCMLLHKICMDMRRFA